VVLRRTLGRVGRGTAFLIALVFASGAATAPEETYLQDLASEIEKSIVFLDEASAAIDSCGLTIGCFQNPEPYASRIDNATAGLRGVHANLSALDVPAQYNASHAKLKTGYQQIIDGLTLLVAGLRENDLDKVSLGAELVGEGKRNRSEGINEILSQPPAAFDLVLVLIVSVLFTAGALIALVFFLGRQASHERQERVRDELATCPKCGHVLDQWWTYRRWQIRQWRVDHLKSHERDTRPQRDSGDGRSG